MFETNILTVPVPHSDRPHVDKVGKGRYLHNYYWAEELLSVVPV